MKAKLIIYKLTNLDQYHKVLVNRNLFGFIDNSNNNSYHYKRKGILKEIPNFRLPKGAIIVKEGDHIKVISILHKHKVKPKVFDISIKQSMLH